MSMFDNTSVQTIKLALLTVFLTLNACHSSSDNDNNNPYNDDLTPVLSESNWRLVVGDVFDVFTHAIYDDQLISPEYSTIEGRRYEFPFANSNYASYSENACAAGGVVTQRRSPTSCDGRCFSSTRMLYACASSDLSLLGRIDVSSDFSSTANTYDALSLKVANIKQSLISGSLGFYRLGSEISSNIRRSAKITRYESTQSSGKIVLIDVDTVFGYGTDSGDGTASAQMQGTLALSSPRTGDTMITATVTTPFINENSEQRRFSRGSLELQAEDGSRLVLTAKNENAETFNVILSNDSADTITLSEPWDDWIERLSFTQPRSKNTINHAFAKAK